MCPSAASSRSRRSGQDVIPLLPAKGEVLRFLLLPIRVRVVCACALHQSFARLGTAGDTAGLRELLTPTETDQETDAMVKTLGRFRTSDEIAKAVVFLASDDGSYVTGVELFADGGLAQVSAPAVRGR